MTLTPSPGPGCQGAAVVSMRTYCLIVRVHLAQLDQDRAARPAARRVPGARRIAHVHAGAEVAVLVGEHALQHEELLAAAVDVRIEGAVRRVAHDAGGARHLLAVALQHAPVHAGQRRSDPGQLLAVHHRALAEIGIDFHCPVHPAELTPSSLPAS